MKSKVFTRSFIAMALVLCLMELCAQLFMTDTFDGRFDYGFGADAGFYDQADGTVELRRTGGRKFWPQRFPAQKPAGTLRVMTIGDSIARGPELEETYSTPLGKALQAQLKRPVESWNLSIPGYGAERKRIVLERVLRYQPDLVILHLGMSNEFEDERDHFYYAQFNGWHPRQWPMKSYLLRWLHEFQQQRLIQKYVPTEVRITTALNDAADEELATKDPARMVVWRATFTRETTAMLDDLRRRHIPFAVVPRVVLRRPAMTVDDDGLYAVLKPLLKDGEPLVDLSGTAIGPDVDRLYTGDGIHMNKDGHARLAQILLADTGVQRQVALAASPK